MPGQSWVGEELVRELRRRTQMPAVRTLVVSIEERPRKRCSKCDGTPESVRQVTPVCRSPYRLKFSSPSLVTS